MLGMRRQPAGQTFCLVLQLLFRLFILTYQNYSLSTHSLLSENIGTGRKLADLYRGRARFCVGLPIGLTC